MNSDDAQRLRDIELTDLRSLPAYADTILERMRDDEESDWPHRLATAIATVKETLTPPEHLVLQFASRGLVKNEIAEVAGLSPDTVKTHLTHVRQKLRAKNTTQAVGNAVRDGIIP